MAPDAPSQFVPQWLVFRRLKSSSKVSVHDESIGERGIGTLLQLLLTRMFLRLLNDLRFTANQRRHTLIPSAKRPPTQVPVVVEASPLSASAPRAARNLASVDLFQSDLCGSPFRSPHIPSPDHTRWAFFS